MKPCVYKHDIKVLFLCEIHLSSCTSFHLLRCAALKKDQVIMHVRSTLRLTVRSSPNDAVLGGIPQPLGFSSANKELINSKNTVVPNFVTLLIVEKVTSGIHVICHD